MEILVHRYYDIYTCVPVNRYSYRETSTKIHINRYPHTCTIVHRCLSAGSVTKEQVHGKPSTGTRIQVLSTDTQVLVHKYYSTQVSVNR